MQTRRSPYQRRNSNIRAKQSSLGWRGRRTCRRRRFSPFVEVRAETRGGKQIWAPERGKDITLHYPADTKWWRCGECHGNRMSVPWQQPSNCGLILLAGGVVQPRLATVAWSSDTQFSHISSINIVHELFHQWIDHCHQQSVKRSKNTVSTGLCFLLSEWRTNGWADLKRE